MPATYEGDVPFQNKKMLRGSPERLHTNRSLFGGTATIVQTYVRSYGFATLAFARMAFIGAAAQDAANVKLLRDHEQ